MVQNVEVALRWGRCWLCLRVFLWLRGKSGSATRNHMMTSHNVSDVHCRYLIATTFSPQHPIVRTAISKSLAVVNLTKDNHTRLAPFTSLFPTPRCPAPGRLRSYPSSSQQGSICHPIPRLPLGRTSPTSSCASSMRQMRTLPTYISSPCTSNWQSS